MGKGKNGQNLRLLAFGWMSFFEGLHDIQRELSSFRGECAKITRKLIDLSFNLRLSFIYPVAITRLFDSGGLIFYLA